MTPADLLVTARGFIVTEGWCQNHHRMPYTGEVCTVGALSLAANGDAQNTHRSEPEHKQAYTFLQRASGCLSVLAWNDADDTTFEDVLDLFDRAIAEAKEQAA